MLENIVKTPLNYTGNKSRILDQLIQFFPKKIDRFVDLCCGGASVGLNVKANNIVCIDINSYVIDLLRTLKIYSERTIINKIETIINEYNLSDSYHKGYSAYKDYVIGNNGLKGFNKTGYTELRNYFNRNKLNMDYYDKSIYLFVLLIFCFNNDIRFNSKQEFNMPIGKTDFNNSIRNKLKSFKEGIKDKNIDFFVADFKVIKEFELSKNDFVYVDPPYLITDAVYNESGLWNDTKEKELLSLLSYLHTNKIKFALSNVLKKANKENTILLKWIKDNHFTVKDINYHYRSSSYNKKNRNANEREVLVMNYEI